MAYFIEVYCRIAIRLCVGSFDDGRERYKTVNIWNVRRDVTADQVAAAVRTLEPILDGRVVRVLLIRKDRLIIEELEGFALKAHLLEGGAPEGRGETYPSSVSLVEIFAETTETKVNCTPSERFAPTSLAEGGFGAESKTAASRAPPREQKIIRRYFIFLRRINSTINATQTSITKKRPEAIPRASKYR